MNSGSIARIDTAGMMASSFCAVHCIVSPILLAVISIHGLRARLNEDAEWVFAGLSISLGMASLLPSYIGLHRRTSALTVFGSGTAILLLGRLIVPFSDLEAVLVVSGALLMTVAHATNRLLCRICPVASV